MHEIRWNPLIQQWIIVAAHRATRPWRPEEKEEKPPCPFCPGAPELKHLDKWDVVVLPNRYPALVENAPEVSQEGFDYYRKMRALGVAEVVVETPSHEGDLCDLSIDHATKLVKTYVEESRRLSNLSFIHYVSVFRNKGKEIGVSLTHPHSQIYALPFIPPRIQAEVASFEEYFRRTGRCLVCDIVRYEAEHGERVVYRNKHFLSIVPFYAMWPYEIHVYPLRHISSMRDMSSEEMRSLADVLRVVSATYNAWLKRDAPYIMAFHDHPAKGSYLYHFHVEFYQPYRDREKLKYAAGIEWGYWVFTYDGVPEERARELRNACSEALGLLREVEGVCG